MTKSLSLRSLAVASLLLSGAFTTASASAVSASFKSGVDADSNGSLDAEEFVMAMGEREMTRRDTDGDGQLSTKEWLGDNKGEFQKLTIERFNINGDNIMSAAEIVEVYIWVFGNRDKNKDGKLTVDEAPKFLLNS